MHPRLVIGDKAGVPERKYLDIAHSNRVSLFVPIRQPVLFLAHLD